LTGPICSPLLVWQPPGPFTPFLWFKTAATASYRSVRVRTRCSGRFKSGAPATGVRAERATRAGDRLFNIKLAAPQPRHLAGREDRGAGEGSIEP
jgi:hypothetical protein